MTAKFNEDVAKQLLVTNLALHDLLILPRLRVLRQIQLLHEEHNQCHELTQTIVTETDRMSGVPLGQTRRLRFKVRQWPRFWLESC